jgi:hypothetical protein
MEPRMGIRYTSQMPVCANFFWNIWIRSRKILLEEVQGVRKEEEDLRPPCLRRLLKTIINVYGIYLFWSYFYKTDCAWFWQSGSR